MSDNQSENSDVWMPPASSMPPIAEVKNLYTMKMERIVVQDYPFVLRDTHIDLVNRETGETTTAVVALYTVDDDRVRGYLPSKVWIGKQNGVGAASHFTEMSFYCTPSLPDGARPFGTGPMYVWEMYVPSTVTVEYDVEARVFVDQVIDVNRDCWYVFVCGEDQLGKLIVQGEKV